MNMRLVLLLVLLSVLFSCNNSSKQKELELKEKELSLREKELKLKESQGVAQRDAARVEELSNVENLVGYWFVPHGATINIKFKRDGTFSFNDYNLTLGKDERLTGSYQLENGVITLLYDDRPKQKFKFYKGDRSDENYYIKKVGYYFVKGENGYED